METEISTDSKNKPLKFFQPFNVLVAFSFFSPLIIAVIVTSLSFIFQNFKGLIYLGFLIGFCLVREFIYFANKAKPLVDDGTICTSIQYSPYGNSSFSSFVFAFTITYLSVPMFLNGTANLWIFTALISYFFIDIFIKLKKKCILFISDLFLNVISGIFCGYLIISLMNWGGSSKYLFFNEESSNRVICTQPSTQTFKCKVYKNGELIGNI
jgi:hypothetical protein